MSTLDHGSPAPFRAAWDPDLLERVMRRVGEFRMPAVRHDVGWRYGTDPAFLERLVTYWRDEWDPSAAQATLNRFPQLRVRVADVDVHLVHVVGEAEGRRPLLLTHGWPGSVYEFWDVIEPLAFPSRHGGAATDAFDLVIPSLPGSGFSGVPAQTTGPRRTAHLFDTLMRHVLGYPRYLAAGSDWGAGVTAWIALDRPSSVHAIHLAYLLVRPDEEPRTEEERAWHAAYHRGQEQFGAYSRLQETKPASLAYATADNPVGQLAWIVERFHDWSDLGGRRFEDVYTFEQLVTAAMTYVLTDRFATSLQYYADAEAENARYAPPGQRVSVRTAFSAYPSPAFPSPPRSWVERVYPVDRWYQPSVGGHFPAMEVPDLYVRDLKDWAKHL